MDAHALVFDIGDRVTGWGRVVRDEDSEWLDLARVIPLSSSPGPRRRSNRSIRVVGLDFAAVPTDFDGDRSVPDYVTVTGTWLGDGIEVEQQSPDRPPRPPQARYTPDTFGDLGGFLRERFPELQWDVWGPDLNDHDQPTFAVGLLRVTAELADWVTTQPEGSITLQPSLTPAPPPPSR